MISEAPPIFVPSGPGFKASYSLTFSSDPDHCIHLFGSLQGDAVSAKTLMIDNGANSAGCRVTLRGKSVPVPAYAVAYVDCGGALDAVISSNSSTAKIGVDVLTYSMPEQIIAKKTFSSGGLPPIAVSKSGRVDKTPTKILSIGEPVTAFVDLTAYNGDSDGGLKWGFSSTNTIAALTNGSTYRISMTCESLELWVYSYSPSNSSTACSYQIVGG
jgi:hypothetical protein